MIQYMNFKTLSELIISGERVTRCETPDHPSLNYIILLTCKIHLILSPGAIIAVVQTPAKKPDVKI